MTSIPVKRQTVDMGGTVVNEDTTQFHLMPCDTSKGLCPECAVVHEPEEPHNAQSLYYQYKFYGQHNRWPTWADAIAHCSLEIQGLWREALKERNAWNGPDEELS